MDGMEGWKESERRHRFQARPLSPGDLARSRCIWNEHHIEQMLLVCADGIIESASAAARMFVQEALAGTEAAKQRCSLRPPPCKTLPHRLQEPMP